MEHDLRILFAIVLLTIRTGAAVAADPVVEVIPHEDHEYLSATLLGEFEPGKPVLLAVRWDGPYDALLDVWLDLDGDGIPEPEGMFIHGRSITSKIEIIDLELPQNTWKRSTSRLLISARRVPEKFISTNAPDGNDTGGQFDCSWDHRFTVSNLDNTVHAMAVFDDGSGPALYVGGSFSGASGVPANHIARWDGSRWSALSGPLGTGVDDVVNALKVFDDGSGPALYVGGAFHTAGGVETRGIARWDGSRWSALSGPLGTGVDDSVFALEVFDNGSRPALYVGGAFHTAGGVEALGIAQWDGSRWSALSGPSEAGVGLDSGYAGYAGYVYCLAVFDDGEGQDLYAGGLFTTAGGLTVNHVARWNGIEWSALSGPSATGVAYFDDRSFAVVEEFAVYDEGAGKALFATGFFLKAGGAVVNHIARWDGRSWSSLEGPSQVGIDAPAASMVVHDDGHGEALYVGGSLPVSDVSLARWDGTTWTTVAEPDFNWSVEALGVYDDGTGSRLFAGGGFTTVDNTNVNRIAQWDGTSWSALDEASGPFPARLSRTSTIPLSAFAGESWAGLDKAVWALSVFDDGSGQAIYVGGDFRMAGDTPAPGIARWHGASWSLLGNTIDFGSVSALLPSTLGDKSTLIIGGVFGATRTHYLATWDGTTWTPLPEPPFGSGVDSGVRAIVESEGDAGPSIFVGGHFTAAGGLLVNHVAGWDGHSWSALDGPFEIGIDGQVRALAVFDDGRGPALYAGGHFTTAGGLTVNNIARWDGQSWSALRGPSGKGTNYVVQTLAVFDDGRGPALYVGGYFSTAGGERTGPIARWDGSTWSAVTAPGEASFSGEVYALTVFDDGSGPALYAGGNLGEAGGHRFNDLARWNGTSWSTLRSPGGTGVNSWVYALNSNYEPSGNVLWVGGAFTSAGGVPSSRIAAWRCGPDTKAPESPTSLSSTSHAPGVWSSSTVVEVAWSPSTDTGGSGLAGYSVLFDDNSATVPDESLEVRHPDGPTTASSGPLGDGATHYFHLRSCDAAGNCSGGLHLGPFLVDGTPPGAVTGLTSPSHLVDVPTTDATIDLVWTQAVDATSGVTGYGVEFSAEPVSICQDVHATDQPGFTSPRLGDGSWYAHVCAVDAAGNWGNVATSGPFIVDTMAPHLLRESS